MGGGDVMRCMHDTGDVVGLRAGREAYALHACQLVI